MGKEIWKDIPGYEGKYMANKIGDIKSLPKYTQKSWRILSSYKHKNWYLTVQLCFDGDIKRHLVHRLVLSTFIWESKLDCNHKNWIRDDNRLENLEWCTRSDNLKHKYRELWYKWAFKWKFWKDHHSSKKLGQYDLDWILVKEWYWAYYAWRELWITPSWITAVCRWNRKTAWGFIWKYI